MASPGPLQRIAPLRPDAWSIAATAVGVALALAFPFIPMERVQTLLPASEEAFTIGTKLAITAILGVLAFAFQKRRPDFFQIRSFGWRDLGAMLFMTPVALSLVALAGP